MADILIKGMEMPKGCTMSTKPNACPLLLNCSFGMKAVRDGSSLDRRSKGCPLVALPEHGDLVDVKAIEERSKEIQYERGITYKEALLLAFDEASVVVEATK